jgi:hypothetical protein
MTVVIEAPRDAISAVLKKHTDVRRLFDNHWLHLLVLNEQGRLAWRYDRDAQWAPIVDIASPGTYPELEPA